MSNLKNFDPDSYLASKQKFFDPDVYLHKKGISLDDSVSKTESLLRGAAQGLSFGFSDEITGALESALTDKTYTQARDESRANYHKAQEDNPISYGAGEIGASIGTSFIPGLGMLNAAKGANLATKVGLGALQGGLSASGLSEGKNAEEVLKDTAIGAGIGGALPIAIDKVIVPGAKAINQGAKKVLQAASGVDSDEYSKLLPATAAKLQGFSNPDIEKIVQYADDPSKFQNAKSIQSIKNQIDDVNLQNKLFVEEKETALKRAREELADKIKEYKQIYRDTAQDFVDASSRAESSLKSATPPESVYDDVLNSVANLKKAVSEGSSAAFEVLDKENVSVPKNEVVGAFKETLDKLKIDKQSPVGSIANKDFAGVLSQVERLQAYPDEIKGSALKRIIQDLDNELEYADSLGDISSRANAAKKSLRHNLDEMLKNRSATYRQFMSDTEMDSRLLQKANKLFGTEDKVLQKVNSLSLDAHNTNLVTLDELNPQAKKKLHDYLIAKYNLNPERFKNVQVELPEFSNLTQQDKDSFVKNGRLLNNFERNDLINQKTLPVSNKVKEAQGLLDEVAPKFKENYISPQSTENLINSYLKPAGPKIEPQKKLQNLINSQGENVGRDIEKDLMKTSVANVFDRSTTNGSRNTLMSGSVGAGVGGAIAGPIGATVGAGVGGALGYFSDKLSGVLLKGSIDLSHSARKLTEEATQKIMNSKYGQPLIQAAQRGNHALAVTHFLLSQQDPQYREMMKEIQEEEQ